MEEITATKVKRRSGEKPTLEKANYKTCSHRKTFTDLRLDNPETGLLSMGKTDQKEGRYIERK